MTGGDKNMAYRTRYGNVECPSDAAEDLLYRACYRLWFLQTVFEECGKDGHDFTLPGYTAQGLSTILKDISHDVYETLLFYYGEYRDEFWNPEPGKIGEARGPKPVDNEEADHA